MTSENNLSTQINFDQQIAAREKATQRILEISISAPELKKVDTAQQLNLALVLDRSGSMAGHKIEYAKQAAAHVVDSLKDNDCIALVQYDNDVDLLFPSSPLNSSNRVKLTEAIRSISTGATTNLSGGWLTGCQEVAKIVQDNAVNRTLLLTDGLANVGMTDPEQLALQAREIASRGVSTSTFGIGADFNQHLLEAMANQGGGRFYFIESPQDIPNIFAAELKDLLSIFAKDIEITLSFPESVEPTFLGDWRTENLAPGKVKLFLGSLVSGRSLDIYAKLAIREGIVDEQLSFKVGVFAKGEHGQLLESSTRGVIHMGTSAEADAAPQNTDLLSRFARVELAQAAAEALKLEKAGDRVRSSQMLKDATMAQRPHIDPSLHAQYMNLSDRMAMGMDELDRKRMHSDTYERKQKREEYQSYDLDPRTPGHLVFSVRGHSVLLNTGSAVSIGNIGWWRFLANSFQLQPEYQGMNTQLLSKMLGVDIEIILGMDALRSLCIDVDHQHRNIRFSWEPRPNAGFHLPLTFHGDVPSIKLNIAGKQRRLTIDTFARLFYLPAEILVGYKKEGRSKEIFSELGVIETDVYQVPTLLGGQTSFVKCGVLPHQYVPKLAAEHIDGILGTEIFDSFRATLAFPKGELSLDHI